MLSSIISCKLHPDAGIMSKNYFSNQSHDKEKNKVMGAQHKDKFKNSSDNLIWDKVYKLKREDWRKTKITKMPYRRQGRESYSTKKKCKQYCCQTKI